MKKSIDFKVGDKSYSLMFNTKALAEAERSIGRSLVFMLGQVIVNPAMGNAINIDFTVACLNAGIQDKPKDFDAYDFIDSYCEQGGNLDELNAYIFEAIVASGLFTKGDSKATEKAIQAYRKVLAPLESKA